MTTERQADAAGCRYYAKRNRTTGTEVGVYDARAQGIENDDDYPWAAMCWTHGSVISTQTLREARELAVYPEFCTDCFPE